jgi:mono/diheme cytochrome c family protein
MHPRFLLCLLLPFASTTFAQAQAPDFAKEVLPILQSRCAGCHGEAKQRGGLRLDRGEHLGAGGDSGKVVVPGSSPKSLLWQRVSSTDLKQRMPPTGEPLTPAQLALVQRWIDDGAKGMPLVNVADDAKKKHWAFQPLQRHALPKVGDTKWGRNAIDAFILAKLDLAKLAPTREAERGVLLRRLKYDLLGLPPTPEEVAAFVADRSPDAYEKLVDRYLASPHFGERWARHWLDVVRFAESDGFETNLHRPNAWPYRDYVIRAFNDDLPYDRFIAEQLAGDTLGADEATGFLVGGPWDRVKSPDIALTLQQRADELHDMISTTSTAFLGLTVGCARCHNHKFDPIPQVDYFGMHAMFAGVQHGERPLRVASNEQRAKQAESIRRQLAEIEAQLASQEPLASPRRVVMVDDSEAGKVSQLVPRIGLEPHRAGVMKGQLNDAGDFDRLPNLGRNYSYWKEVAGKDVFAWNPQTAGRFRVWLSWGSGWNTHAPDARYVLDLDGDLATKDDQVEIARVDQRKFADGSSEVPGMPLWSGFHDAGVHTLKPTSRVVLRGGATDAYVTADLLLLQEVGPDEPAKCAVPLPGLRLPVHRFANVERFAPVDAKFVRLSIQATNGAEPCIDELEIFTAASNPQNVALAKLGAKLSSSGEYPGNPIHQLAHLNDGRYGNSWSWISNTTGRGWVVVELPTAARIDRVVWSRDRAADGMYADRLATKYRIEVATKAGEWQLVASSDDRLPLGTKVAALPLLTNNAEEREKFKKLAQAKQRLGEQLAALTTSPMVYAGRFTAPEPTHRLHRGDPLQKREAIAPATLTDIGTRLQLPKDTPEAQRRVALAKWIAEQPLTPRVMANRLWHYHFGTGIVATPSDFGINGAPPSHPELLDWLASELVAKGWSLKHLHRLIVTSSTYRQASTASERGMGVDAGTRLLWRMPPRRLEAEPLRDAILAVSGKLDLRMGGPGFDLFEPNGNYVKVYTPRKEFGPAEWRRLVYQSKPRMQLDDVFGAFDCPDAGQIAPKRNVSTTPLQALSLLNSPFLMQQAKFFAERLEKEAGADPVMQAKRGIALALGRDASAEETQAAARLIRDHGLPMFCRALFNANEFLHVE